MPRAYVVSSRSSTNAAYQHEHAASVGITARRARSGGDRDRVWRLRLAPGPAPRTSGASPRLAGGREPPTHGGVELVGPRTWSSLLGRSALPLPEADPPHITEPESDD